MLLKWQRKKRNKLQWRRFSQYLNPATSLDRTCGTLTLTSWYFASCIFRSICKRAFYGLPFLGLAHINLYRDWENWLQFILRGNFHTTTQAVPVPAQRLEWLAHQAIFCSSWVPLSINCTWFKVQWQVIFQYENFDVKLFTVLVPFPLKLSLNKSLLELCDIH